MSQPRFPDPARSRALLIGASHFTAVGSDLPDVPAVQANLTVLRQVLTSADTGVLRPELCRVLADPTSTDEIGTALSDAAAATDLLLVYYVGHGLVDDRGRLHLALAHTHPHRARWTALPLDLLREEIATSAAATRVLVLDCCFSGRAIDTMADNQAVISGQLEVTGTYTLTSTTATAVSHAPAGDRYTAFTGALLRALDETEPLTLDQIYVAVDRDLAARNLPRPQRRAVNAAGDLALSRGPATNTKIRIERPDSDAVRFTHTYSPNTSGLYRPFRPFLSFVLVLFLLLFLALFVENFYLAPLALLVLAIPLMVGPLLAAPTHSSEMREVRTEEFLVDRSGLTLQRKRTRTHLPWRDIAQVGVLQFENGALNSRLPAHLYTRQHILVVQLRPESPTPSIVSVLSGEYRQLGYLGLCTVEDLGSSRQEMTNALERFASGKLVHSSRQFLDRDPRLRPEMM